MSMAMTQPENSDDLRRRRRNKNFALAGALLAFVVVVYLVSIVRMTGG